MSVTEPLRANPDTRQADKTIGKWPEAVVCSKSEANLLYSHVTDHKGIKPGKVLSC